MAAGAGVAREAACGVCGEEAVYLTRAGAARCRAHWDAAGDVTFGEPQLLGTGRTAADGAAFCLRMVAWAERRAGAAQNGHERAYWEAERARWRRLAGTRLYRERRDLALVAAHLGHAGLDPARINTKLADEDVQAAVGGR